MDAYLNQFSLTGVDNNYVLFKPLLNRKVKSSSPKYTYASSQCIKTGKSEPYVEGIVAA